MRRVTNGFASLNLAEFSNQLWFIVNCMTDNVDYPVQQPDTQELKTFASEYDVLADAAVNGGKRDRLARDASRSKIVSKLHSLGRAVDSVADGDEDLLISSGFPYTQQPKPSPDLEKPRSPEVMTGVNPGEIICKTGRQAGVKSFNFYITTDAAGVAAGADNIWKIMSYNKSKYTFSSLVSGQRYYIKVGLVGVRGQEVISDVVSYIAQ